MLTRNVSPNSEVIKHRSAHFGRLILSNRQPESPLLRLPAELRNEIYHHVLGGLSIRTDHSPSPRKFRIDIRDVDSRSSAAWQTPGYLLALTETCRKVYDETSLFPYSLNVFECDYMYPEYLSRWTSTRTPRQLGAILQLRVGAMYLENLAGLARTRDRTKIVPDSWNEILRNNPLAISLRRLTKLKRVIVVEYKYPQATIDLDARVCKPGISKAALD